MPNNQKFESIECQERRKGRCAGQAAALGGYKRKTFSENERSKIYEKAYNEAYDRFASSSSEEQERRQGEAGGKRDAQRGFIKKDFVGSNRSSGYIQAYSKEYDSVDLFPKNQQQLKDKSLGKIIGQKAGLLGYKKSDFSVINKSPEYIEAYEKSYDRSHAKFLVSSFEDQERRKGKKAGQQAAFRGQARKVFANSSKSPHYQKAYLEGYDQCHLNKKKKVSHQDTSGLADGGLTNAHKPPAVGLENSQVLSYGEEGVSLETRFLQPGLPYPPGLFPSFSFNVKDYPDHSQKVKTTAGIDKAI